jgi:hypothetical protein
MRAQTRGVTGAPSQSGGNKPGPEARQSGPAHCRVAGPFPFHLHLRAPALKDAPGAASGLLATRGVGG